MKNKLLLKCLLAACALTGLATAQAQDYQLTSPDGKLNIGIYTDGRLQWSVSHDGTRVLLPSDIALKGVEKSSSGKAISFGPDVKVRKATRQSVNTSFATPFYKKAEVNADPEVPRRIQRRVPRLRRRSGLSPGVRIAQAL